jgi:preprotein translocase subunit SecF
MKWHKFAIFLSIALTIASIALVFIKGLNVGIDFAGGILMEVRIEQRVEINSVRDLLSKEIKDIQIQNITNDSSESQVLTAENKPAFSDLLIRVAKTNEEQSIVIKQIQSVLDQNFPGVEYNKIDYVGPQVGSELVLKGFFALLASLIAIMIYIWVRFDWQFGIGGILALIHDAVMTIGFLALTGLEFNITSVAAVLTVIGYSVNDSVVIYDRIRENLSLYKRMNLSQLINSSINSTLSRTILTSGFTLLSLVALMIFGGDVLFSFSASTFFGILVGTYSSIYVSAPILIYFDPRKRSSE